MIRIWFFIFGTSVSNVLISAQLYVLVNNGMGDNSDVSNQTIISSLIQNGHIGIFSLAELINLNTSTYTNPSPTEEVPIKKDQHKISWLESNNEAINEDDGLTNKNSVNIPGRPRSCSQCTCGLKFRYKIVNGYVSEKYEFPWMVFLIYSGQFKCGATLINDLYILSAASCVKNFDATKFVARFNEYDQFTTGETNSFEVAISQVTVHPQYSQVSFDFDFSLLKLATALQLNTLVPRPICLPKLGSTYDDQLAEIAGWGRQIETGTPSGILLDAVVRVTPLATCNTQWGGILSSNIICMFSKDHRNICFGDNGGPLMVVESGRYRLAGVLLFGEQCVNATIPSICSRTTSILPWILANTRDACYCADTV